MYNEIVNFMKSKEGAETFDDKFETIFKFDNRPSIVEVSEKFNLIIDGDGLTQGGELIAYWIYDDPNSITVYK